MALQVWLPLTKDTRQQGLSNVTVTNNGATFTNGGKLGGKYFSAGTITIPASSSNSIFNGTHMSFSFWLKPIGTSGTGVIFGQSNMSAGNNRMYSIFQYPTPNDLHISWQSETSNSTFIGFTISGFFEVDKWTHCALVYDGSKLLVYKNGILSGTYNGVNTRTAFNYDYPINGSSIRCLNDFRIYDHCLSPMEVKELSKGLVLHYPLNRGGWGQENLLSRYVVPGQYGPTSTAAGGRTTWLGDYKITIPATENADTYFRLFMSEQLISGQTYTISCQVDGLLNGSAYRFPMFAQSNTAMGVLNLDHNGLNSLTFTMNWTGTQTAATGANGETVYVNFLDDSARTIASGQGPITISNFKLEKGDRVTPWCPNILDSLYNTMGLNETTEYDCSGFCNNGMRTGTFSWTSDTPKYSVSTYFEQGVNSYIVTPAITFDGKGFTGSYWFKSSSTGKSGYQMPLSTGGNYEMSISPDGKLRGGIYVNGTRYVYNAGDSNYLDGKWHMFTMTYDGATICRYVDGVLKHSETISGTSSAIPNVFAIGRHGASNTTYGSINLYESDVRIYATALSADDVKSLYQNSAYIDSSGNVYGAVHSEV